VMKFLIGLALIAYVQCIGYGIGSEITTRRHMVAMFGLQEFSITGSVQVADPSELCVVPSDVMYTPEVRVMFIHRGNCTFYLKAQNAMALGASAVVIANAQLPMGPDEPIPLGYPPDLSPSAITIPVLSVAKSTFDDIVKANIDSHNTLVVHLSDHDISSSSGGSGFLTSTGVDGSTAIHDSSTAIHDSSTATDEVNPPDDHDGNDDTRRRPRMPSRVTFALGVTAIVALSCLVGFCCGRRRRNQMARTVVSQAPAPLSSVTVRQGQGYTQVDMASAPAGYYGQEMMPVESLPTPSAPAYAPSAPSAEMRYA